VLNGKGKVEDLQAGRQELKKIHEGFGLIKVHYGLRIFVDTSVLLN
jgi:hypothetical protein